MDVQAGLQFCFPHATKSECLKNCVEASMQVNLSSGFANNKGADQPAHPRKLISVFVIRYLESNISKLDRSKISFY